jgi:hypothetical protein
MAAVSEIANIRKNIANEYMAARWGLSGLAYGTSKHQFITARMERMEQNCETLQTLVGFQEATEILSTTLATLPEKPERYAILDVIRHLQGNTEKTAHLIDYVQDMWETIDLLKKEFGEEDAQKIVCAPGIVFPDLPQA